MSDALDRAIEDMTFEFHSCGNDGSVVEENTQWYAERHGVAFKELHYRWHAVEMGDGTYED